MSGLRGSPRRKPDGTLMTETLRRELLRDYLAGGMSNDQIADKYGVSVSYAPTMAKRRGLDKQMEPWMIEAVLFETMPPPPPVEYQRGAPREDKPQVSGECPEAPPKAKAPRQTVARTRKQPLDDPRHRGPKSITKPKANEDITLADAMLDEVMVARKREDALLQAERIRRYFARGVGTTRIAALLRVPYKVVQEVLAT